MKIASFCFHFDKSQIGGAQVPAVAFKQWAEIFGIECDLVTLDKYAKNPNPDIPYEIITIEREEELNKYDAVFFSTPDRFGGTSFDFSKIKVKKAIMAHGEFDKEIYGGKSKFQHCMDQADVKIVIGKNYWNFKEEYLWCPCTLPQYLLKQTSGEPFKHWDKSAKGILYSARISSVKNAHLLAMLSKVPAFKASVDNRVDIFGATNTVEYGNLISSIEPDWNAKNKIYNVYNEAHTREKCSGFKWFWDVSSTDKYKFEMPRLNLAAIEAMRYGVVPIAWHSSIPESVREFTIDVVDVISNPAHLSEIDYYEKRFTMLKRITSGHQYSYRGVKEQLEIIFNKLLG